jgi:hypothetical protein
MALDPSIALQVRPVQLPNPLENAAKAAQVAGLRNALEEHERQKVARAELASLGQQPTQEQLATWAARHGTPDAVMRVQQSSLDRQAASADRKAAADAAREQSALQFAQNLDLRQQDLDRRKDEFLQRTTYAQSRQAFEQWY